MHNVEIKAELRDLPLARAICGALKATKIATLEQTDTYFKLATGRLKKRECAGEPTEYVFYDRDNRARPRLSHFTIYSENEAAERFGATPMPVWVVVKKTRELWMLGSVRIHLDTVEDLGTFIEFEALVSPSNNVARCHETVAALRGSFAPAMGETIAVSYSDMIAGQIESQASPEA